MKKNALYAAAIFLLFAIIPIQSNAAINPADSTIAIADSVGNVMMTRLYEIKLMDKSALSSSEKKALRKEVKDIRQEMRTAHNGIYLSVGAVIIIILLLILIL